MSIFSRQPERDVFDAPSNLAENLTGDYAIDTTHTRLGFSARHAMVTTVRGGFTDFEGNARIDTDNPAASHVEIVINAASIDTGVADRDGHLKSRRLLRRGEQPADHASPRPRSSVTATSGPSPATSPSRTSPSPSPSSSSRPARPRTRSATPASASRARPPSAARSGASPGTPRSRPAACSSPTRSSSSSTSPPSRRPDPPPPSGRNFTAERAQLHRRAGATSPPSGRNFTGGAKRGR